LFKPEVGSRNDGFSPWERRRLGGSTFDLALASETLALPGRKIHG